MQMKYRTTMADVSTSFRYLWKILLLLSCLAISWTLSEDVEVDFPQAHLDTAVEYDLLHNNRFRREASDSNLSTTLPPEATTTEPKPPDTTQPPVTTQPSITTQPPQPTTTKQPQTDKPSTTTNSNPPSSTIKSQIIEDSHSYYSSKIIPNEVNNHWIDLPSNRQHTTLSKNYRTAVTIDLKFPFRFYGHNITNVTVATGGFLYTSPFLHQWLTATQYIAPLMANFDTRKGGADSAIYYDSYDDNFIVQWKSVKLGNENITEPFEFEVILAKDGTIKFLYKTIPVNIDEISDSSHPVKIGLSDAFYIDTYFKEKGIRRRTIYEYHRVAFNGENVQSGTVIILTPLPTCNTIDNCGECATHVNVAFKCKWCNKVNRCSDGIDWHRQTWLEKGCKDVNKQDLTCPDPAEAFPVAAVISIIIVLVLISALCIWLYYAYTHPTSASGMWLLENRPSRVKEKLSKMQFFKKSTPSGTQYQVESTA